MPFSAGTFSRIYNWATEGASPPISIAKLDTQEADLASGLSNCILRDGTGLPTAATPWNSQNLTGVGTFSAVTVAASSTITSSSTVTGTAMIPTGSSVPANGMYLSAANTVAFASNTTLRASVNSTGNWTFAAPSSGSSATINGVAGSDPLTLATSGGADGRCTISFTNTLSSSKSYTIGVDAAGGTTKSFDIRDITRGVVPFSVGTNGNVTINAPSSGTALTVNGVLGQPSGSFAASGSATVQIQNDATYGYAGTTTNHGFSLISNGNSRLLISNTGAISINAPASGTALAVTGVGGAAGLVVTGSASTPANSIGSSSTAFTVDCSKSNVHYVTMTGNVAGGSMTISNMQDGQTINLVVTNGAGPYTLGNATGVKWPGGVVGALTATNGAIDIITITQVNSVKYATIAKGFA